MPHILVVRHAPGPRSQLGTLADALDATGATWESIEPSAGEPVPDTLGGKYDGLIVLGGAQTVTEIDKHPFLAQEIDLLKRCVDENRPVLGICLGSQLLAAALSAPVYEAPKQEVGWQPVRLSGDASNDALLGGLPETIPAFHWHQYRFDLPKGAVRLASSEITPNQAFRYGGRAWGIQFHPEIDLPTIRRWIDEGPEDIAAASTSAEEIEAGAASWIDDQKKLAKHLVERWTALL